MSYPGPVPYAHAIALLCDFPPSCPAAFPVTSFVARLFDLPQEEVQAAVDQRLADLQRNAAAFEAQRQGQTEADLYGDNALDGDFGD